ncbi:MAG: substrate-binding domain-containing protein, partial [Clostridiaceae bacterium]|nr:substrate-binding domain-containing protein [Clostridiaceae bacterium]
SYLIAKGNKKIAYFGSAPEYINASASRYLGYKSALETNGIAYDEKIAKFSGLKAKDGYETMLELINEAKFDSVFCSSDELAMGVINALRENNIKVPDEVDVVGFDNIYVSSIFYPKLTTIEQPMYDMGSVGMRMLIKIINKKKLEEDHIVLNHLLIERDSCK